MRRKPAAASTQGSFAPPPPPAGARQPSGLLPEEPLEDELLEPELLELELLEDDDELELLLVTVSVAALLVVETGTLPATRLVVYPSSEFETVTV